MYKANHEYITQDIEHNINRIPALIEPDYAGFYKLPTSNNYNNKLYPPDIIYINSIHLAENSEYSYLEHLGLDNKNIVKLISNDTSIILKKYLTIK